MRTTGIGSYIMMFLKYFAGYFVLIASLLLAIFNGRAMLAQAQWNLEQFFTKDSPVPSSPLGATTTVEQSVRTAIAGLTFAESDAYIVIPKIKVAAPVVFPDTLDNVALLKSLEKGVIKYRDSAQFGKVGTAILLGHSSAYPWYRGKYGSVFALLEKLENGDQFAIAQKNGTTFYYQVHRKQIIVPSDFKVELQDNQSHLVLISCWPVRSNKMRMTVWSDLIKAE